MAHLRAPRSSFQGGRAALSRDPLASALIASRRFVPRWRQRRALTAEVFPREARPDGPAIGAEPIQTGRGGVETSGAAENGPLLSARDASRAGLFFGGGHDDAHM